MIDLLLLLPPVLLQLPLSCHSSLFPVAAESSAAFSSAGNIRPPDGAAIQNRPADPIELEKEEEEEQEERILKLSTVNSRVFLKIAFRFKLIRGRNTSLLTPSLLD